MLEGDWLIYRLSLDCDAMRKTTDDETAGGNPHQPQEGNNEAADARPASCRDSEVRLYSSRVRLRPTGSIALGGKPLI